MDSILDLSRCFSSTIGRAVKAESILTCCADSYGGHHAQRDIAARVGSSRKDGRNAVLGRCVTAGSKLHHVRLAPLPPLKLAVSEPDHIDIVVTITLHAIYCRLLASSWSKTSQTSLLVSIRTSTPSTRHRKRQGNDLYSRKW